MLTRMFLFKMYANYTRLKEKYRRTGDLARDVGVPKLADTLDDVIDMLDELENLEKN